jgi:BirA family transcriptional regulator, biotin operon repressor / biotin---[acetyl-CoA-carboxylase] ligase
MVKHIHIDSCDSTQELLKEQLVIEPQNFFIISCQNQLSGRGRRDNVWIDSPTTLCFSLNMIPSKQITFSALEMSILACRFFESKGVQLKLKWPNDLLDNKKKKCAGILVQNIHNQCLVGIGVNLSPLPFGFGGVFEAIHEVNKKEWVNEIGTFIHANRYSDVSALREDWEKRCIHMRKKVTIIDGDEKTQGIFMGLGDHGEAIIQRDNKFVKCFNGSLILD